MEGLGKYLSGMTGVVISGEDAIASAKAIRSVVSEFKGSTFTLKGGSLMVIFLMLSNWTKWQTFK